MLELPRIYTYVDLSDLAEGSPVTFDEHGAASCAVCTTPLDTERLRRWGPNHRCHMMPLSRGGL